MPPPREGRQGRACPPPPPPPPPALERFYADMVRIRTFEERVIEQFQAGAVKGTAHSYIGEEAIAVGTCAHLRDDDYVASYHRGHGHCIAKGARTDRMMAELMGRETGYCRASAARCTWPTWSSTSWARTASSAPPCRSRSAPRSRSSSAAAIRWSWRSSATAPTTRASSTNP